MRWIVSKLIHKSQVLETHFSITGEHSLGTSLINQLFSYSSSVIPVRNHMLKEIFDDKLHTRLEAILKKFRGEFQKYYEVKNERNVKELNLWKDKIKSNVVSSKNLGILAINLPCNSKNRYTQIQLISKVEEIETELIRIQANSRSF